VDKTLFITAKDKGMNIGLRTAQALGTDWMLIIVDQCCQTHRVKFRYILVTRSFSVDFVKNL
jgi:hypothetical protein